MWLGLTARGKHEGAPGREAPARPARQRSPAGLPLFLAARQHQPARVVARDAAAEEGHADAVAERLSRADEARAASPTSRDARALERGVETRSEGLPEDAGTPLDSATRAYAEPALGVDLGHVRVHSSRVAQGTAGLLGARAFSQGSHVWLGPGEREADRGLMAHELAHVALGSGGIYLRQATWLERRAWLSFFDHYLPRKFLNNYMDDTGNTITLTPQEMIDVNPRVDITKSAGFKTELAALQKKALADATASGSAASASASISAQGPGQAMTNGTLGNFTIKYKGTLTVESSGGWSFDGMMSFYDFWDFDPKPFGTSGRSDIGEIKTRVAAVGLPGQPFAIDSVDAPLTQTGSDPRAVWAGGKPKSVNDKAGRAGADVGVGGVGGDVAAGPPGADVGSEVGAQAGEDLNP